MFIFGFRTLRTHCVRMLLHSLSCIAQARGSFYWLFPANHLRRLMGGCEQFRANMVEESAQGLLLDHVGEVAAFDVHPPCALVDAFFEVMRLNLCDRHDVDEAMLCILDKAGLGQKMFETIRLPAFDDSSDA